MLLIIVKNAIHTHFFQLSVYMDDISDLSSSLLGTLNHCLKQELLCLYIPVLNFEHKVHYFYAMGYGMRTCNHSRSPSIGCLEYMVTDMKRGHKQFCVGQGISQKAV